MSKVSTRINRMKDKLDSVSGLDDEYVDTQLDFIERILNIYVGKIERYADKNEINGTVFKR